MSEKFRGIEITTDDLLFDSKKINLPYTIFIIKPETCLNWHLCQDIIGQLEAEGFEIKSVANRELTRQETENIYYNHQRKDYFKKLVSYNATGESLVLLLSHASSDPILTLKKLVGPKDPEAGKKSDADSLRSKHGKDIIKNEFYASDDQLSANKERDIFRFPIPQRQPLLKMDKYKIGLESLWTFLHPKTMEHSDVGTYYLGQRQA